MHVESTQGNIKSILHLSYYRTNIKKLNRLKSGATISKPPYLFVELIDYTERIMYPKVEITSKLFLCIRSGKPSDQFN